LTDYQIRLLFTTRYFTCSSWSFCTW